MRMHVHLYIHVHVQYALISTPWAMQILAWWRSSLSWCSQALLDLWAHLVLSTSLLSSDTTALTSESAQGGGRDGTERARAHKCTGGKRLL